MDAIRNLLFGLVFCITIFTGCSVFAGGLEHSVTYQNKKLEYAYFVPKNLKPQSNLSAIILVPGLNGKGETLLDQSWMNFADKKNWIIIAPSFVFEGEQDFQQEKSYQYPKVWSGGALKAILKQFSDKGYKISSLYMMGFSAGAQFVGRYAFLNPQQVKKCAIIASGGNDKITKSVPVKFFYGIGKNDASNRRSFADTFEKEAKGKHISLVKKEYENVGHTLTQKMQDDVRQFFN